MDKPVPSSFVPRRVRRESRAALGRLECANDVTSNSNKTRPSEDDTKIYVASTCRARRNHRFTRVHDVPGAMARECDALWSELHVVELPKHPHYVSPIASDDLGARKRAFSWEANPS